MKKQKAKNKMEYIDSHVHCGRLIGYEYNEYLEAIKESDIKGAIMFAPVPEIYDRDKKDFQDNEEWKEKRKEANEYVLSLRESQALNVYPFFFVWNDFSLGLEGYFGIKWHRHEDEPRYNYKSKKCKKFVEEIKKRNLPVILEEEFENTLFFINELAKDVKVIIPHLGLLNGGYEKLKNAKVWERKNIYADSALASSEIIKDYIDKYGHERLLFGSDFPFGFPNSELKKILNFEISQEAKNAITSSNILGLIKHSSEKQ